MAKVLFINPVIREEDAPKHIPYGMALLAAMAMDRGHLVQVYDANAWRKGDDVLTQACRADDWDVIAVGGLTTAYSYIQKAARIARREAPGAFIVAGGGFLTGMPLEVMRWNPAIDLGVVGEAFVTFPEVLGMLDRGERDFSRTAGVVYRAGDGPRLTTVRPNIPDLDALPWPAWDLFPLDIYFKNSSLLFSEEAFTSKRRIDVNGSFGCSLVCRYCWHLGTTGDMLVEADERGVRDVRFTYGRTIRYHSPAYIARMVRHLHDAYQVDFASFIDENLMTMDAASGRTWIRGLCEAWVAAGLQPTCRRDRVPHDESCRGVHWSGTSHATLHTKEALGRMFEAGCSHLVYGLETFDPGLLRGLGKGSTVANNLASVKLCLDSGIKPLPNIIIGFPEESFQSIRNTLSALLKLGIHAKPHFATPYPGSEWYYTYKESIVEQYGGDLEAFVKDLGDAQKPTAVISHRFSAMELIGLQAIVAKRDTRLLDQAERHAAGAAAHMKPVAVPRGSFNFVPKKVKAPIAPQEAPRR